MFRNTFKTLLLQELKQKRSKVVSQLTEFQEQVASILKLLSDEEVMKTFETMRDPKALSNYITKEFNVRIKLAYTSYTLSIFY